MNRVRLPLTVIPLLFLASACVQFSSAIDLSESSALGPSGAPVELIVFSDFQCSFCKRAAAEIRRIVTRHPSTVRVHYKHYPLSYHPQAVNAAKACEAAGAQGRFWEMHDLLFAYAGELTDEIYPSLARKLELDVKRFEADMASDAVADKVARDRAEGEEVGVDGTPYFVINKVPFNGSYADLERAIMDTRRGRR